MPVVIDIKQDARYQQGLKDGMKQVSVDMARRLLAEGIDLLRIKKVIKLSLEELEEIQRTISDE